MFNPKPDEKIIRVIRRYGPTHAKPVLLGLLFLTAAFFFMFWLFRHGLPGQVAFILLLATGLMILLEQLIMYIRNVCYVTDCRVFDIEWRGFYHCVVSDIPYDQIEDVSGQIQGVWGLLLRYGNVYVQTGGGTVRVVIDRVKQPIRIQQLINDMRERYLAGGSSTSLSRALHAIEAAEPDDLRRITAAVKRRARELEEA